MSEKKTEVITFRTTPSVKEYLDQESQRIDRPTAWIVNKIITDYINEKSNNKKEIHVTITHNENINI